MMSRKFIEYLPIDLLIPYGNNPRKNDKAVDAVAASIKEFGFQQAIVIDIDNVVVAGHTRLKAAKKLGMQEVPCIRADDLTAEQVKAFRLADNKVGEIATWDFDLLADEMMDISLNLEDFGFEYFDNDYRHESYKVDVVQRNSRILNMDKARFEGVGKYDIPQIFPVTELPEIKEWIGFNYVLSDKDPKGKAVHFFVNDYQFERLWNDPEKYVAKLSKYACVLAPDFSPYEDMPLATQIFNHYRKHWVAAYLQMRGVRVVPTIRASADERSLDFYLDGEPKDGIVCISNVWTSAEEDKRFFLDKEFVPMVDKLKPRKIFVYGKHMDELDKYNVEYIDTYSRTHFKRG